jgi:ABC-type dipeptide/oligopeptide/nickel transport system permease subunit
LNEVETASLNGRGSQEQNSVAPPAISPGREAWHRLRRNPVAVVCGLYIVGIVLAALFANVLTSYAYDYGDTRRYASLPAPPDAYHRLGVDNLGEDVFSRLLYGARVSLGVAVLVVTIEVLIGVPLGLMAGYFGKRTDMILSRITDVMFAFPDVLLAILLRAVLMSGQQVVSPFSSLMSLCFALGVVSWPGVTRLVRGQAMALRAREFIEAARATGVRDRDIIRRHLLPNLLSPIIVQVTQDVAGVILAEATLSFLGLGVQPPYPSWGRMIYEALPYMEAHPLLLMAPSLALALTVMAFNFFGDALRDALDPRLRQ